jgi:hypothetical protein
MSAASRTQESPAKGTRPRPARQTLSNGAPTPGDGGRPTQTAGDQDWQERAAAAVILGEPLAGSGPESFLTTDALGAFVVRESHFWD